MDDLKEDRGGFRRDRVLMQLLNATLELATTAESLADEARACADEGLEGLIAESEAQARQLADHTRALLGQRSEPPPPEKVVPRDDDSRADEASRLSFPASDAPAY